MYFDLFGIEYIPQEVLNQIKDDSFNHNKLRILLGVDFTVLLSYNK